jgi:hypothetical protein
MTRSNICAALSLSVLDVFLFALTRSSPCVIYICVQRNEKHGTQAVEIDITAVNFDMGVVDFSIKRNAM